jgi:hypothetical protein
MHACITSTYVWPRTRACTTPRHHPLTHPGRPRPASAVSDCCTRLSSYHVGPLRALHSAAATVPPTAGNHDGALPFAALSVDRTTQTSRRPAATMAPLETTTEPWRLLAVAGRSTESNYWSPAGRRPASFRRRVVHRVLIRCLRVEGISKGICRMPCTSSWQPFDAACLLCHARSLFSISHAARPLQLRQRLYPPKLPNKLAWCKEKSGTHTVTRRREA